MRKASEKLIAVPYIHREDIGELVSRTHEKLKVSKDTT
jgi:hypothetical protein